MPILFLVGMIEHKREGLLADLISCRCEALMGFFVDGSIGVCVDNDGDAVLVFAFEVLQFLDAIHPVLLDHLFYHRIARFDLV